MLLALSVMLYAALLFSQLQLRELHEWKENASVESQLREVQQQEYQRFRESTDTVRHIGHELKYILAALPHESIERQAELIKEMAKTLTDYETHMDTGNDTLDALLSLAWNHCRENGVKWTCLADGSALRSVAPTDLYILLGNALDNAIESAVQTDDPEKRFLSLNIWKNGGCAFIKLANYCRTSPTFVDGVPITSKSDPDSHGYGMRSICDVVERLGGEVSMSACDEVFTLDIVLPVSEQDS